MVTFLSAIKCIFFLPNTEMKNKYAYKIEEIYMLENPLPMNFLKDNFNFTPPQAYTYLQSNPDLKTYIQENVMLIPLG